MAFQTGISQLITDADEQNVIWRALLRSIHDHGGSAHDLNLLLEDARCADAHLIIDDLAKRIIGDGQVWQLVENPIPWYSIIGTDIFRHSAFEVVALYEDLVEVAKQMRFEEGEWSETTPKEDCSYRLHHFKRPRLFQEVLDEFPSRHPEEHASWRELVVYAAYLKQNGLIKNLRRCRILAAGSQRGTMFPVVDFHVTEDRVQMGWKGVKRVESEKFELNCFWLVRVYD